jgi:hypothetical protein
MMREAELDEVKKQIESVSSVNIAKEIEKAVDPTGDLAESLKPPEMPDLNAMVNEGTLPAPPPSPPAIEEAPAPSAPPASLSATSEPAQPEPGNPESGEPEGAAPGSAKPASAP